MKKIFNWVLPLLGIVILALVMFKRAPETSEEMPYFSDYGNIDESQLAYRELDGIGIELATLTALALDPQDRLYVAGDKKLLILQPAGNKIKSIDLVEPAGALTVAEDGRIYVAFRQHVEVYDDSGKRLSKWKNIDEKSFLTSVAILGKYLIAADAGTRNVWKFDLSGKLFGKLAVENKKEGIPQFIVPSPYFDLASAQDGSIWVVNTGRHKLENFSVDGKLNRMWGESSSEMEGFCGCCNPTHIALLKDGSMVTSEKGYPRVKVYDPNGVLAGVVAGESQFKEGTKGLDLAVDSAGKIYVLDPKLKRIRIFKKK